MRPVRLAAEKSRNESREFLQRHRSGFCNQSDPGSAKSLIFLAGATRLEPATSGVTGRTKFNDFNVNCQHFSARTGSCSKRQKVVIKARRTLGDHFGDEAQHIELTAAGIAPRIIAGLIGRHRSAGLSA